MQVRAISPCRRSPWPLAVSFLEPMPGFEPGTYGLRRAGAELERGESSRIDGDASTAEANPRASSRIDEQAFVDKVSLDLIGAHARWIAQRDRAELQRHLLGILQRLV
jgi:hypothetical protein